MTKLGLINYIVNYGPDGRHHVENKCFTLYRDALEFYNKLDREKWGAGNIVKILANGHITGVAVCVKKSYIDR